VRRILLKLVIRIIRRNFQEGISVITDINENIVGYKWAWTVKLEDELFGKNPKYVSE